jgi:cell shape-determining protein MreD
MAWGAFSIVLLLVFLVQTGVVAVLGDSCFDAFLMLALLCGLLLRTHDARIAAWIVGLAEDLGSADALGIHAFTLGLTALLLTYLREIANVNLWWARGLATFLAAWPGQVLYLIHLYYWAGSGSEPFWSLVWSATLTSLLAAAVATPIAGLPGLMQRRRQRRYRSLRM